jgi:hypothetical protein
MINTWSRIKKIVTVIGDHLFYVNKNPLVLVLVGGQNKSKKKLEMPKILQHSFKIT